MLEKRFARTVLSMALIGSMACTIRPNEPPSRPTLTPVTQSKPLDKANPVTPLPERKSPDRPVGPVTTPIPKPPRSVDDLIRDQVWTAKKSPPPIEVQGGFIKRVTRTPWIGGDAYISTLERQSGGLGALTAILLSSECVFDAFVEKGVLVNPTLGFWAPEQRVDRLSANVLESYATFRWPILDVKSIRFMNIVKDKCEEVKAKDQLIKVVKSIDWEKDIEKVGEAIRRARDAFLRGFR